MTQRIIASQSRTGRQGNLFAFYALRNGNSRRHNRHNLCLCDSGGGRIYSNDSRVLSFCKAHMPSDYPLSFLSTSFM